MKKTLITTEKLDNGLEFQFFEHGNRYFGDYHQVKVTVCCLINIDDSLISDRLSQEDINEARKLFGETVEYTRVLKSMGVSGGDVEKVRADLIANFINSTLPYLQVDDFASKYVFRRLTDHRTRGRMYLGRHD